MQADSLPAEPQGKPKNTGVRILFSSRSSKPGIELGSPALQVDYSPTELSGSLHNIEIDTNMYMGYNYIYRVCNNLYIEKQSGKGYTKRATIFPFW